MTPEQLKVILSAEDRTSAVFGNVARNVDKMGFNFDTLKGQAIGALGALSVPVSAAGLLTMVNSAREAVDKLKDLEDATGASVEKISALDSIARSTGSNIDTVGAALIKFNAVLKDADPEKGAGAVLKALNLDIDELKRLDPADALRQVAIAFQVYAEDGKKARAVQELFGKSIKEVGPFLKDLAEAKRLDAKLTADQIEQVDKFNKEWAKLKATAEDASRSFSVGIIGELNNVIAKFKEGEKAGKSFLDTAFGIYKGNVADFLGQGPSKFKDAQDARAALKEMEGATFRLSDQDPRMIAARERVRQAEAALSVAGGGRGFVNPPNVKPEAPSLNIPAAPSGGGGGKTPRPPKVKDPVLEANQREADMLRLLGKIEDEETQKSLEAAKLRRVSAIEELELIDQRNTAYQTYLQTLQDATPTAQLEKQRETMAMLAEEYERGRFGIAGSAEAVAAFGEVANTYLGNVGEGIKKNNDLAETFGSTFAGAFERMVTSGKSASEVMKQLAADLLMVIIRQQVIQPIASGAGNLLSLFTGFNSYDGGGYTGSGARSGGVDGKGGFMAVLHPQETVIDHTKGQGMGGASVVLNYTIDARGADPGSEARFEQALKASEARTKSDILASIGRGGVWSRAVGRV